MSLPVIPSFAVPTAVMIAAIMHQHKLIRVRVCRNIIGVKILDFKVIDFDRTLEQFMLNLLNNDILAVIENKDITCTEVDCACPTFLCRIERVRRR